MLDHRIVPVDEGWQPILTPNQPALGAIFSLLQLKTQTRVVAFILNAIQATTFAPKAHPFGLAYRHAIKGLVRSARQGLGDHRFHMVSQPTDAGGFGKGVQAIFRKLIPLAQSRKGGLALLLLSAWQGTGGLPGRISPHEAQAALPLGEESVVELTSSF